MKISVRNLEPTKVRLTVTVDPEEFNPYLDNARKEIAKQVNVPGFRKGHVPGKIIDQRIGFGAVAGEAVNNGVPELYSKALEEKGIHPMAQPEIDVQEVPESAKDETKLKFVATVERRPDIELPAIDGMEIEVAKAEITDEDINNRLEALRQRFGTLVGVDRPAAKGDYANIDLTAEIDGEVVDSQEGVSYELGSETMLDGLDEALEGLSSGEETTFEGTLEAGEHEGEKAQVKVKVNSVKAEELPELDDDFALEIFHSGVGAAVLAALQRVGWSVHVGQKRDFINPQGVDDDMHMDIPAVVMPVRVGAYKGLVSGEMCLAELLAQLLRPVYGQAVVCPVPWVKADDIVVAFHIFPFLVFLIAEIGSHTGNGEILAPAVEGRNAVILPRYQPPIFIKGGLHGKLVMFKGEVLLGCAIIRIFRADMFECCQQRHLPFAGLQTSRQQGQKWRRGLQRTGRCMVCRTR